VNRRALIKAALAVPLAAAGGCGSLRQPPQREWHRGRLTIGTGNPTGVFYQVGTGYADVISRHVPGFTAVAAPTGGAADNLLRLGRDDVQIALTFSDVANDAVNGDGVFGGDPVALAALARIYDGYAHLVVRKGIGITTIQQLKGHSVSTGTVNSGTEFMAKRMLTAAGLDPDKDVDRRAWSLTETTAAMKDGSLDALFFVGGLPTLGITGLMQSSVDKIRLLPLADLLPAMTRRYGDSYGIETIDKSVYGVEEDTRTLIVGNLITVDPQLPADLGFLLTKVIFDYQSDLVTVHPEWGNVTQARAAQTSPVSLHPGAARYFGRP
jgi:TRAP transporter TAXI family solute receptor